MALTITYNTSSPYTIVDFDWEFTVPAGVFVDGNLPPKDVVQIEWQANEADPNGNPYGGLHVSEPVDAAATKTAGMSMVYDDKESYFDNPNGDDARYQRVFGSYAGVPIALRDGDKYSRDFYIKYFHAYSSVDYSISWTYGSPSVTFTDTSDRWLADGMALQDDMENSKNWDCNVDSC